MNSLTFKLYIYIYIIIIIKVELGFDYSRDRLDYRVIYRVIIFTIYIIVRGG